MAFEIVIFLNLYMYANSSIFCFYCHMSRETSSANKCTKHEIILQEGMQLGPQVTRPISEFLWEI